MRKICGIIGGCVLALLCTACGSKKEDFKLGETAYARGNQTAAERFVLQATKAGNLALDMDAAFTEEDLADTGD